MLYGFFCAVINCVTKLNFSSSLKVSYAMIRSLLLYFNANGFTNDQVLKGTNLSLMELNRTDAYASEDTYDIIFENCVALSEDPFFGMHLGSKLSLHQLGVVGYLLMNSDTFENALYAYQSFQASLGESVVIKTVKIGSLARVTFELYGGVRTGQHRIESFLTALQATCFELTGRKLIYSEIGLNFKLTEPSQEYINMTGVLPKPSDENFVELVLASYERDDNSIFKCIT